SPPPVSLNTPFAPAAPSEIQDAARVDGADRWRLVYSIVLPLARPGMVAVFLVSMLTTWNNFLIPLIFTRSDDSQPLTIVLTLFIGQYEVAWEDMSAAAVVTTLPPFLMALFFQRYLVRGLTMGAVK
ncbi:MAG: carbohydrate ABC transporter permease, partial [Chloroflexi bacterium]|nr:carbohydrate ABC transporter permease [Chloroflexota bacterium]